MSEGTNSTVEGILEGLQARPVAVQLDPQSIEQVLNELPSYEQSSWAKFMQWLTEWLAPESPSETSWLLEFGIWLQQYETLLHFIVVGAFVLLCGMLLYIVAKYLLGIDFSRLSFADAAEPVFTPELNISLEDVLACTGSTKLWRAYEYFLHQLELCHYVPGIKSKTRLEILSYLRLDHQVVAQAYGPLGLRLDELAYGELDQSASADAEETESLASQLLAMAASIQSKISSDQIAKSDGQDSKS